MAAVPPAASWALATRLMVTKLVNDCASGVCSRTSLTACAIRSRSASPRSASIEVPYEVSIYELSLMTLLPTLVLTNRFKGSGLPPFSAFDHPPKSSPACTKCF